MSFIELLENYIKSKEIENKSPRTLKTYKSIVNQFLKFLDKKEIVEIQNVTTENVVEFLQQYKNKPSRSIIGVVTKNFLRFNDIEIKLSFFYKPREVKGVDIEYLKKVYDSGDVFDKAILSFLVSSGLRANEMISLKMKDINFEKREGLVLSKGKKSYEKKDKFVFSVQARNDLIVYLGERISNKESFLFLNPKGKQWKYWSLWKYFSKKFTFTLHKLRHTFCYEGSYIFTPIELKILARHKSFETTQKYIEPESERIIQRSKNRQIEI